MWQDLIYSTIEKCRAISDPNRVITFNFGNKCFSHPATAIVTSKRAHIHILYYICVLCFVIFTWKICSEQSVYYTWIRSLEIVQPDTTCLFAHFKLRKTKSIKNVSVAVVLIKTRLGTTSVKNMRSWETSVQRKWKLTPKVRCPLKLFLPFSGGIDCLGLSY